ncbi:hypothetical protein TSUD_406370 [Trifolium subterraneum]|uniref:Reverse transcriptase zinc-binding domain-containing protein n=1 Tax=Trifolium subterraneum TaxID=3900 RepID=A0A2Z6NX89_TRISU|nr:hypothetical protein TSUD_406370 [Trifolium subterraneum]
MLDFRVCSPINVLEADACVSQLIDSNTRSWNRNLISQIFSPFEAQQILNIPLSWRLPNDKLIWHWEKDGNFSVRSAHHMIKETDNLNIPEASSSNNQEIWKAVWKIKAPPSVKNFLWRLARDILPTRGRLKRKGLSLDTICLLCFEAEENRDHLFMRCRLVQQTWFCSSLGLHIPSQRSLQDWLVEWLSNKNILASQLFGITLWKIWQGRNLLVFQNTPFDPRFIASAAADFTFEFNGAENSEIVVVPTSHSIDPWCPPPPGMSKLNVDAGCFNDGFMGCGMVIRDNLGSVLFAATMLEKRQVSSTLAEALALRWVLYVCH